MAERGVKPSSYHRTWSLHCIITHFPEYWESLHNTVLLYNYCTTPYTLPPVKCFLACQLFTLSIITINSSYYMVVLPGSRTVTGKKNILFCKGGGSILRHRHLLVPAFSKYIPTPNRVPWVSFFNPVQWVSQSQVPFLHTVLEQATCSRGASFREFWCQDWSDNQVSSSCCTVDLFMGEGDEVFQPTCPLCCDLKYSELPWPVGLRTA